MSTVHKSLQALYIYVHNLHFFFSHPLERSGLARDGLTKKKKKKKKFCFLSVVQNHFCDKLI